MELRTRSLTRVEGRTWDPDDRIPGGVTSLLLDALAVSPAAAMRGGVTSLLLDALGVCWTDAMAGGVTEKHLDARGFSSVHANLPQRMHKRNCKSS